MKFLLLIMTSLCLWSCSNDEETAVKEPIEEVVPEAPVNRADLVEIRGKIYTEYYDAKKTKIKFQGEQDDEKRRNGKWTHYLENGNEAAITFYSNGVRNGHSIVKHPNGALYYHGEYKDDKPIGVWKYYDEKGKLTTEHDYDKK